MPTFYIDGTSFSNSTAIYTDAALDNCAPDGFYSDGIISREQVGCRLLPEQICPNCAEPCGTIISQPTGSGLFRIDVNEGNDTTGAIVVKFNPNNIPSGISVIYDSVIYNKVSSPVDGYHASTNPSGLTYVGTLSFDCGISGNTYVLNEYLFSNGSYSPSGFSVSVSVAAGDVSLSATNPGLCVMVIPKPNNTPSTMSIVIASPCGTAIGSTIDISCPQVLLGYESSNSYVDSASACSSPTMPNTYYNVPVTGDFGAPALFDWVFSDINGEFILPDGYYKTPTGWIEVQDGIVITVGVCP
jgi:hypothetical protein